MQDAILAVLNLGKNSLSEIARLLNISKKIIKEELDVLVKEGIVAHPTHDRYGIIKVGQVEAKEAGYGFLHVTGEEKDYYVPSSQMSSIYDGDKVSFYPFDDGSKLLNVHVLKVIERGHSFIIGKYKSRIKKGKAKQYIESTNAKFDVKAIVKSGPKDIPDGMIVYATIQYVGTAIEAHILEILGHSDDPGIEISQIALEYGFPLNFSSDVIQELPSIPTSVSEQDIVGRRDFRNQLIFTIDGKDSKDFDDAISIEMNEDGTYQLGVYIADVTHYVKENTPLDKEALKRGTSVYLADRVIPMIPHKLSNGICSLNEGVNRLVLACLMKISNKSKLLDYEITEGVICSKHRMTYEQVNKIFNGDQELCKTYNDLLEPLKMMRELSQIIRSNREKKGALSFETMEFKFELNQDGSPKHIIPCQRDAAEELIEDFMLMANETIAYHLNVMNLPAIYRVHEKPDQEKILSTFQVLNHMGLKVTASQKEITPYAIQSALKQMKELPTKEIMNQLLLRSMKKAKYAEDCLGHYGLAMHYYCHFTSPIRRYPDLMVHRILKECLLHPNHFEEKVLHFEGIVKDIAYMNSMSEKKAVECEREVNDMLFAWYMEQYCFEAFKGMITSITNFGLFVTLSNGVEGLVAFDQMRGYYYLNSETMTASNGRMTYHLGDIVEVVVMESNRKSRKIDFMMKNDYEEKYL